MIDWGHVVEALNKLDAGVPEKVTSSPPPPPPLLLLFSPCLGAVDSNCQTQGVVVQILCGGRANETGRVCILQWSFCEHEMNKHTTQKVTVESCSQLATQGVQQKLMTCNSHMGAPAKMKHLCWWC